MNAAQIKKLKALGKALENAQATISEISKKQMAIADPWSLSVEEIQNLMEWMPPCYYAYELVRRQRYLEEQAKGQQ